MGNKKGSFVGLLPLIIFVILYIISTILTGNASTMPLNTGILIAIICAFVFCAMRKKDENTMSFDDLVTSFCKGGGDDTLILMFFIFLEAGIFSGVANAMGAVSSASNLGLKLLPASMVLPGIFIIGCVLSFAMGTSMGTVSALMPIGIQIANVTGMSMPMVCGAVVGGAMFGDNLSFISDTTIAATRTQGCEMGDKFRMNFLIVLPAALLTVALLWFSASGGTEVTLRDFELIRVLPYIAVLVLALTGLNAFIVLATGILLSGLVGLFCGIPGADGQIVPYSLLRWGQDIYKGFTGMNEIMVLSMLIGGLGELIRYHGGIAWLLARVDGLARRLAGKSAGKGSSRVGESCIALLASLADICTANNTVAIILTGGLAREIALKNGIDPRRSASLLDIFSCVFQGLIPWAAQLLLAGSLAKISPLEITINNWYCMLLAVAGILAIILGLPRIKARSTEA